MQQKQQTLGVDERSAKFENRFLMELCYDF